MKPSERYKVEQTKQQYPPGTRLELKAMDDSYAPVPPGTRGTVAAVDDVGTYGKLIIMESNLPKSLRAKLF